MQTSALLDQAFRDTAFGLVSSFNMDWHVATPDAVKGAWESWVADPDQPEPEDPFTRQCFAAFNNDPELFAEPAE